jgi:hypothetical protein
VVGLVACVALTAAPACDLLLGSTKVSHGERYQVDDARYDPFFDGVHRAQVAAAAWPDEHSASRAPLRSALSLGPSASDAALVAAVRARVTSPGGKLDVAAARVTPPPGGGSAEVFRAVEQAVRLEVDRARKLAAVGEELEELAQRGADLRRTADREFENRGADKADEKKTEAARELRRELGAGYGALRALTREARRRSREAEDLVFDLASAVEATERPRGVRPPLPPPPPPPPPVEPPKAEKKPEEAKPKAVKPPRQAKPPAAPRPAEKPPAPPERPAPKPAPPPDDVFNP